MPRSYVSSTRRCIQCWKLGLCQTIVGNNMLLKFACNLNLLSYIDANMLCATVRLPLAGHRHQDHEAVFRSCRRCCGVWAQNASCIHGGPSWQRGRAQDRHWWHRLCCEYSQHASLLKLRVVCLVKFSAPFQTESCFDAEYIHVQFDDECWCMHNSRSTQALCVVWKFKQRLKHTMYIYIYAWVFVDCAETRMYLSNLAAAHPRKDWRGPGANCCELAHVFRLWCTSSLLNFSDSQEHEGLLIEQLTVLWCDFAGQQQASLWRARPLGERRHCSLLNASATRFF